MKLNRMILRQMANARLSVHHIIVMGFFIGPTVQPVAGTTYEPYAFSTLAGGGGPGSADGTGSAARFSQPEGIAVDGAGNVFVADGGNATIRKISPGGVVTTWAGLAGNRGNSDGPGSLARFFGPTGLALDGTGNLYVSDASGIRKITPTGVVSTQREFSGIWPEALRWTDNTGTGQLILNAPFGVAVDAAGNLYVADYAMVREDSAGGVLTIVAGSTTGIGSDDGTGAAARFNGAVGLAVDGAGNLYVADANNFTVRKITPGGDVTTLAGAPGFPASNDGTGSAAGFAGPSGMAIDRSGTIYVADTWNDTIRKMTPTGDVTTLAGSAGVAGSDDGNGASARFYRPSGVAADNAGQVYVADTWNNVIRKITPAGDVTTLAGLASSVGSNDGSGRAAQFKQPGGLAADGAGNLYVADSGNNVIRKITPAGEVTTLAGSSASFGSADGQGSVALFWSPSGVATDGAGNVFIADTMNDTIRKITPDGAVTTLAGSAGTVGSDDGAGSAALFNGPTSVALDRLGNLYVADATNNTIRKVTAAGVVTTFAGAAGVRGSADGIGAAAQFDLPTGVAADSIGDIYVADFRNNLVRKITPVGVVSTLAGSSIAAIPASDDGTGSAARFWGPSSVAVDRAGNVFVAEHYSHTLRKITPAGVVTTIAGSAKAAGSEDGVGLAARFNVLSGVAVDAAGNVYVAD